MLRWCAQWHESDFAALLLLFLSAVMVGGGGSPSPVGETLAIVTAVGAAGLAVAAPARKALPLSKSAIMLACALPLLAMVQLLPLPAAFSLALPMREGISAAFDAIGVWPSVWPLTIDPASTMWSLFALAPPVTAFILAARLPRDRFADLLVFLGALALLSAIVGGLQYAGGAAFHFHLRAIDAGPGGLFANQNSQGDFLLIGICACITLAFREGRHALFPPLATFVFVAFLVLSVVLTGSRAAMVLLAVPAMLYFALVVPAARRSTKVREPIRFAVLVLPAILMLAGFAFLAMHSVAVAEAVDRFGLGAGGRLIRIWPDSLVLAKEAFPYGTGLGTFPYAFAMVERLDVVDPTFANRAHCDWLEFVIEAGAFALVVIALALAILVKALIRRVCSGMTCDDHFAVSVLAIAGLHAFVDYPFRSISLSVISAMALGHLLRDEGAYSHA